MKHKKILKISSLFVMIIFVLVSCKTDIQKEVVGIYRGELPCGNCTAIDNKMTLNADKTFVLETVYKGKADDRVFKTKGNYYIKNEQIVLEKQKSPFKYLIGDNYIELLDIDGNKIESELNYKLIKQE